MLTMNRLYFHYICKYLSQKNQKRSEIRVRFRDIYSGPYATPKESHVIKLDWQIKKRTGRLNYK